VKRSEIRGFVEAYLARHGAGLVRRGQGLLEVHPPSREGSEAELPRLLAFGLEAHRQHPEAELVAVGSAFLDRLVGEATRASRYAVVYEPVPPDPGPAPRVKGLPGIDGGRWGRPRPGYRPVFLFVYVAEFRTIDVPDDLVLIGLDPTRGETLANPGALLDRMRAEATAPADGWQDPGALPSRGTVLRSLYLLDRRLQRRARTFKEAATSEIARETANIEAYYRRLIDEVRHPVGRGRLTPEEESRRVRALQLDWKRRVQEVARFWEAGVFVRLSALGVVMRPCWVVPWRGTTGGGGRGAGRPFMAADIAGGALWQPRCPLCEGRIRTRASALGADLVCVGHTRSSGLEVSAN
jgi:hypothetical protein